MGLPVVGEGAAACHLELFKRGWVFSDRASTDEQFLGVHLADGWVQRLQKMLAERGPFKGLRHEVVAHHHHAL